MKKLKIWGMPVKMLGCRVYTDYFGFDLPVTVGVLKEAGLYDVNDAFLIIKPMKKVVECNRKKKRRARHEM